MYNLIDLTDRRILVVGASSGIGKRTAITLSNLGAKLVLAAIDEEGVRGKRDECFIHLQNER